MKQPAYLWRRIKAAGFSGRRPGKTCLALFLFLAVSLSVSAQHVTLLNNDGFGTSSFNSTGHWSDGLAPGPGKSYFTGNRLLRSPTTAGSFTFGGDSLTIDPGGRLIGKISDGVQTLTIGQLILNGGTLDEAGTNADTGKLIVAGAIEVTAPSFLGALGAPANNSEFFETLEITAPISGSAALTVAGSSNAGTNTGVVVLSAANPYSGTITVATPGNGFIASATHRLLQLNHREALRHANLNLASSANGVSFAADANTGPFHIGGLSGSSSQRLADTGDGPVTLEVGGNDLDTTFTGALHGPGRLVKTGAGTLTLTGANTFESDLSIQSGTLALGGGSLEVPSITLSTEGTLDVSSSAAPTLKGMRLGGEGEIKGSLTLGDAAELHFGGDDHSGSLSFRDDLTLAAGATVHLDFADAAGPDHEFFAVGGTLSLDQTSFHLQGGEGLTELDPSVSYLLATADSVTGRPNSDATWVGVPPANAADFRIVAIGDEVRLQTGGTPLYAAAAAVPTSATPGQQILLTVEVTPATEPDSTDIIVVADLSPIGGSSAQEFHSDGTHGDNVDGDYRFSFLATLDADISLGPIELIILASDAEERSVSTSLTFSVVPAVTEKYMAAPFLEVSEIALPGWFSVAASDQAASIHYDADDAAVVRIAAEALRDDIERVTGFISDVSTGAPVAGSQPILVGTLGQSSLIDDLVANEKLDVSLIEGEWEAYTAAVITDPLPGIERALVIAGSDRRGTAFGVFGLSEAMGVSPWYWWGDVPTPQKAAVHVESGVYVQPTPGVQYRGIFLNDEDWGLQPWAANTFEPEIGSIGPGTYATIFELLLRLHANVIWPAMHEWPVQTTPFYLIPENKVVADDYAIVISTSHHEPMLRNSHEYDESVLGPYNYWTNRTNIYNFWEERVIETAGYENIYTVGMRGRTDAGMLAPPGTTDAEKAEKIQNEIIPDQRQMLADHVNPDPSQVPQIFIPYKETLVQYQSGLELPDDITILWVDDNHGYIRQLSNAEERARSGGSGVYYHLSYWGVPRSYLWFCTTPPGMTRSEMIKAWDFDARRMWIVNIGDIKPHEIGTDFFLRMARDPEAFRDFDQHAYLAEWAARSFGSVHADAIATVLEEYYRLNIIVRPEHLNHTTTGFDFVGREGRGDEAQTRLDEFTELVTAADAIYGQLSAEMRPAYYAMVLFPIRGSYQVNKKVLLAERSRLWAEQGRSATSALAAEAHAADTALREETAFYNLVNAEGKWNYMINPMAISLLPGWARETQSPYIMPSVGNYSPPAAAGLGVVVEGAASPLSEGVDGKLAAFSRISDEGRFIDVFNTGSESFSWVATASDDWILLSQASGTDDARLRVNIDWTRVPRGYAIPGSITIEAEGSSHTVKVEVFNPLGLDVASLHAAVEDNGRVVIGAADYTARHDNAAGVGWRTVSGATIGGNGMTIEPVTADSIDPASLYSDTPSLTYEFHSFTSGSVQVRVKCLPTHRITSDHGGVRYAVSINGDTPQVLDLHANEYTAAWNANVLRAYSEGISYHTIAEPGRQTIEIQMIDPGVVLDRIFIQVNPGGYEAEHLVRTGVGSHRTFNEGTASGGVAVSLDATAIGQYIMFELPSVAAGPLDLLVRAKPGPNRGIVQVSIADSEGGPFTPLGDPVDLYASSLAYGDLDPIPLDLATGGAKYLRFDVVGRNASSSDYWVVLDRFDLPAADTVFEPLQAWRRIFFGTVENSGEAADGADPAGDGIPNLLQYATGGIPTANTLPRWRADLSERHLTLTFPWLRDATDITYRVLAGNRLDDMIEIWASSDEAYPGGSADSVLKTVTDPESIDDQPSRFMKLQVTRP